MRRLILLGLMAATALPGLANAQTPELNRDRRDVQQERRDVDRSIRRGDGPAEVREQRRDVREARQELREDRRDYRQDRREAWQDYRDSHRDQFRRPAYAGPRGYRHRPVVIGYQLQSAYFGRRYLIADPNYYRLPPTSGPQRWVRYGNDVLLVNARSGRVLRVYRDFFF